MLSEIENNYLCCDESGVVKSAVVYNNYVFVVSICANK